MSNVILFVHGAWLTPQGWEPWRAHFERAGFRTLAPAWPTMDRPIAALRADPDPALATMTIEDIVDHYAAIIDTLDEPPVLIGHSFGGLIVQMLLDRGHGAAAVALCPAPPRGIVPGWRSLRSALPVLATWRGWQRVVAMSLGAFERSFANALAPAERKRAFRGAIVPAPGRIFFQAALGIGNRVDFANRARAPMLLIAGSEDRTADAGMVARNARRYAASANPVELKILDGHSHFLFAEQGWQGIANDVLSWIARRLRPAPPPVLLVA